LTQAVIEDDQYSEEENKKECKQMGLFFERMGLQASSGSSISFWHFINYVRARMRAGERKILTTLFFSELFLLVLLI
jgi:hypothetical protein